MAKKNYTSLTADFAVCVHQDCPMAAKCLHRTALPALLKTETYLTLINPEKCEKTAECRFYSSNAPVMFARGFTGFQKKMFPAQYKKFMNTLIDEFGRSAYFDRRNGKLALSPKEQAVVMTALHGAGISEDFPFDRYEEHIDYSE